MAGMTSTTAAAPDDQYGHVRDMLQSSNDLHTRTIAKLDQLSKPIGFPESKLEAFDPTHNLKRLGLNVGPRMLDTLDSSALTTMDPVTESFLRSAERSSEWLDNITPASLDVDTIPYAELPDSLYEDLVVQAGAQDRMQNELLAHLKKQTKSRLAVAGFVVATTTLIVTAVGVYLAAIS